MNSTTYITPLYFLIEIIQSKKYCEEPKYFKLCWFLSGFSTK